MGRAASILNKVNNTLKKFTPLERTVYKRTIVRTGGNELLGRQGSTTITDTILDPQPYYEPIGRRPVSGGRARVEVLGTASQQMTADDYQFTCSPTALSMTELKSRDIQLVLKDSSGNSEVLQVMDFEPIALENTVVVITIYARTVNRP
jgi:hypothetical protein